MHIVSVGIFMSVEDQDEGPLELPFWVTVTADKKEAYKER